MRLLTAFLLLAIAWGGWLYFIGRYLGNSDEEWKFEEYVLWLIALGVLVTAFEFLLDKLSNLL